MNIFNLKREPLTKEAYLPYGDVIETDGAQHFGINTGTIERFHDLAQLDVGIEAEGRAIVSIGKSNQTTELPDTIPLVERHPLGTQAFIPMSDSPVVVVTDEGGAVAPARLRVFITNGKQGINYRKGAWHMPLISFEQDQHNVIVDRGGPVKNCDEHTFCECEIIVNT